MARKHFLLWSLGGLLVIIGTLLGIEVRGSWVSADRPTTSPRALRT
jgi:hypothetical protein